MRYRSIFSALVVILLLTGAAFAFPRDLNPSPIPGPDTTGQTAAQGGFPGDWTAAFGNQTGDGMRIINFMKQDFRTRGGGPGGPLDMRIWNSPTFTCTARVLERERGWEFLLDARPQADLVAAGIRARFTTHSEMIEFLYRLPRRNMDLVLLGEIPRGMQFPVLIFSHPDNTTDRTPAGLAATGLPLVWHQGLVHGGEMSAGEAPLALAYTLAHGRYDEYLRRVNVIIVPRINADGAKAPIRTGNDLRALQWTAAPSARDLNRDNLLLDLPVMRAARKLFGEYKPHFLSDMHEMGQHSIVDIFGRRFDRNAMDIGSSGAIINNSTREIIQLRYDYVEPDLVAAGKRFGLLYGWYGYTAGDPYAFDSRDVGLTGVVSSRAFGVTQDAQGRPIPILIGDPLGPQVSGNLATNAAFDPDVPFHLFMEAEYNTRTANNITPMVGTIVQLFENKGVPTNVGGIQMWERRVAAGYICMLSTIETAANRPNVTERINAVRARNLSLERIMNPDDQIPILMVQPMPTWLQRNPPEWYITDITAYPTGTAPGIVHPITGSHPYRDISLTRQYDSTVTLRRLRPGEESSLPDTAVFSALRQTHTWCVEGIDNLPEAEKAERRERQWVKVSHRPHGIMLRERMRPYAYIFTDPNPEINAAFAGLAGLSNELVTRMNLNGIRVHRLSEEMTLTVEGWSYDRRVPIPNSTPHGQFPEHRDEGGPVVDTTDAGGGGWRNRAVTMRPGLARTFPKDTFIVFTLQPFNNLVSMYMEPDIPWNIASVIYLPPMSAALGGAGNGWLSPYLSDMEMPFYRITHPIDIPVYPVDWAHPLIDRGAVTRFYGFPTRDEVAEIAAKIPHGGDIRVFDYDIQVHTRVHLIGHTNDPLPADSPARLNPALVSNAEFPSGKFNMTLPTSPDTVGHMILKRDGTYERLEPRGRLLSWDFATVCILNHALDPLTIDLDPATGRPLVQIGNSRALPLPMWPFDDLIGVRIIELLDYEPEPTPTPTPTPNPGDGSSGCNTGFAIVALLAILPLFMRRKGK